MLSLNNKWNAKGKLVANVTKGIILMSRMKTDTKVRM